MKIVSYNLNGIRAAAKKGFYEWLSTENPDVICLQEIKALETDIDVVGLNMLGYYTHVFSAQKKGYSGVAIFSKLKPLSVQVGCGHELFDFEGRIIRLNFDQYSVLSIYLPSGTTGEVRQEIKMQFLTFFTNYLEQLREVHPRLVICGDYNICREPIDIHDPVGNKKSSGFLPEERQWFAHFLEKGYTDSFRSLFPVLKDQYSWWSYRANARENNKGWRIDYCITTDNLKNNIVAAGILPNVKHSDHCPVFVDLEF